MTDAERIAKLEAKILRLEAEIRILKFQLERSGGPRHSTPPGVQRAKARAWRNR